MDHFENIDCEQTYILEDERALLRPLQPQDIDHLLPFAIHEPELWKYSLISAHGPEGMQLYLNLAIANREEGREYPFIVYDKLKGAYAGCTRFYDIQNAYRTMQLGYTWYGAGFQGTGLNKHCKYLMLSFAFERLGMERIEFRADNDNARSVAAMKSLGCKVEGVLRSHLPRRQGGRRDSIILSILKADWLGGVGAHLRNRLS
ncbi:MAG: GNAT family N-acetyltransferase [Bacteroidota bacterium]|nr:GNAT family N-acetyltransferase [Bacteroidota bacterium]